MEAELCANGGDDKKQLATTKHDCDMIKQHGSGPQPFRCGDEVSGMALAPPEAARVCPVPPAHGYIHKGTSLSNFDIRGLLDGIWSRFAS